MSCQIGKRHTPKPPTSDFHHVLPQAWQRFWQPPQVKGPGGIAMTLVDAAGLWDPRTLELCPNHHRLVHEALVAMMKGGPRKYGAVYDTAALAMQRFTEAGGSLDALRAAGEFGYE